MAAYHRRMPRPGFVTVVLATLFFTVFVTFGVRDCCSPACAGQPECVLGACTSFSVPVLSPEPLQFSRREADSAARPVLLMHLTDVLTEIWRPPASLLSANPL